MRYERCSEVPIDLYLQCELDNSECDFVEQHLLDCEQCRSKVEEELNGVEQSIRRAFPISSPDALLTDRVLDAVRRKSRARWLLVPAVAGAFGLAMLLAWPRVPIGVLLAGVINIDGREYSKGMEIPLIGSAKLSGNVRISFKDAEFSLPGNVRHTKLSIVTDRLQVKITRGSIYCVDSGPQTPYEIVSGGLNVKPEGTRFGVFALGNDTKIDVYSDSVSVNGPDTKVFAGLSYSSTDRATRTFVTDDPTAVRNGEDIPIPTASGLKNIPLERIDELPSASALAYLRAGTDEAKIAAAAEGLLNEGDVVSAAEVASIEFNNASVAWRRVALGILPNDAETALQILSKSHGDKEWTALAKAMLVANRDAAQKLKIINLAVALEQSANEFSERECIARVLFVVGRGSPSHESALQKCIAVAEQLATSDDVSTHRIARLWNLIGEAKFYTAERPNSALESSRKAYALWPRPEWALDLAERMCEMGDAKDMQVSNFAEVFRLTRIGLQNKPTFENYQSALNIMRILADSKSDWTDVKSLAIWIAQKFSSVSEAKVFAANELLGMGFHDQAITYYRSAIQQRQGLVSSEPGAATVLGQDQFNYAAALWLSGNRIAADQIVEATLNDTEDALASNYFERTSRPGRALQTKSSRSEFSSFDRGRLLYKVGRLSDSEKLLREFLNAPHSNEQKLDRLEATLLRAEITKDRRIREELVSRARKILNDPGLRRGWFELQCEPLSYRARIEWLAGNHEMAVNFMKHYIRSWPQPARLRQEETRLRSWIELRDTQR